MWIEKPFEKMALRPRGPARKFTSTKADNSAKRSGDAADAITWPCPANRNVTRELNKLKRKSTTLP